MYLGITLTISAVSILAFAPIKCVSDEDNDHPVIECECPCEGGSTGGTSLPDEEGPLTTTMLTGDGPLTGD